MFVRQQWTEPRLHMPDAIFEDGEDYVTLPPEFFDNLWQPDPYIINSKVSGWQHWACGLRYAVQERVEQRGLQGRTRECGHFVTVVQRAPSDAHCIVSPILGMGTDINGGRAREAQPKSDSNHSVLNQRRMFTVSQKSPC